MKLYYNYPYDGEITEEKTSLFIPIDIIEKYLDELNSFFNEDKPLVSILATANANIPGQKIQIERYDSEYGNYNYEVYS
jgi:hypothetical protein